MCLCVCLPACPPAWLTVYGLWNVQFKKKEKKRRHFYSRCLYMIEILSQISYFGFTDLTVGCRCYAQSFPLLLLVFSSLKTKIKLVLKIFFYILVDTRFTKGKFYFNAFIIWKLLSSIPEFLYSGFCDSFL